MTYLEVDDDDEV